ncbi:calmodulin-dependent protein kinase [Gigaspora margarita]|uniref:Calmodulin-dependent protein kinase n=1 Tax=Gigaspora margarita TaxID=4874 RepID=A0A8H4AIH8_GIGMA|nr:calmodulin-dependent protein kinase [Gigaspora margarita]
MDSNKLHELGYTYQHGFGVEKDEKEAFENYMKAVELGNAVAINYVGFCYRHGIGVEKDEKKAFEYFMKVAELGNTQAIYNVGIYYHNGIGVEKDEKKAFDYYMKAAEFGNAQAIYNVGFCYGRGIGVEKDEKKAFEYFMKAADMSHAGGIFAVGRRAFDGIPFDINLQFKIINGTRPECTRAPEFYVRLSSSCMDNDPNKRPTSAIIVNEVARWLDEMNQDDNDIKNRILEADKIKPEPSNQNIRIIIILVN